VNKFQRLKEEDITKIKIRYGSSDEAKKKIVIVEKKYSIFLRIFGGESYSRVSRELGYSKIETLSRQFNRLCSRLNPNLYEKLQLENPAFDDSSRSYHEIFKKRDPNYRASIVYHKACLKDIIKNKKFFLCDDLELERVLELEKYLGEA